MKWAFLFLIVSWILNSLNKTKTTAEAIPFRHAKGEIQGLAFLFKNVCVCYSGVFICVCTSGGQGHCWVSFSVALNLSNLRQGLSLNLSLVREWPLLLCYEPAITVLDFWGLQLRSSWLNIECFYILGYLLDLQRLSFFLNPFFPKWLCRY